jgi:SPX domain protein involved in polyphosphate accumulation
MNPYRFEKKFLLDPWERDAFMARLSRLGCNEIYHERWVNNLYIDSLEAEAYWDNVDGLSSRSKTRFRWYGESQGRHPIRAERKIKQDDVNRKLTHDLGELDTDLAPLLLFQQITQRIQENEAVDFFHSLVLAPSLINRYRRLYFLNADHSVRITIDSDLSYYNPNNGLSAQAQDRIVIELKAPAEHPIAQDLVPSQLYKSSKYVDGLLATQPQF